MIRESWCKVLVQTDLMPIVYDLSVIKASYKYCTQGEGRENKAPQWPLEFSLVNMGYKHTSILCCLMALATSNQVRANGSAAPLINGYYGDENEKDPRFKIEGEMTMTVEPSREETAALIIGGYAYEPDLHITDTVELFGCEGGSQLIAPMENPNSYMGATFVDDEDGGYVLACGGSQCIDNRCMLSDLCYEWRPQTNVWEQTSLLTQDRYDDFNNCGLLTKLVVHLLYVSTWSLYGIPGTVTQLLNIQKQVPYILKLFNIIMFISCL